MFKKFKKTFLAIKTLIAYTRKVVKVNKRITSSYHGLYYRSTVAKEGTYFTPDQQETIQMVETNLTNCGIKDMFIKYVTSLVDDDNIKHNMDKYLENMEILVKYFEDLDKRYEK